MYQSPPSPGALYWAAQGMQLNPAAQAHHTKTALQTALKTAVQTQRLSVRLKMLQAELVSLMLPRLHPDSWKGRQLGLCQAVMVLEWRGVCLMRWVRQTCGGGVWLDCGWEPAVVVRQWA